MRRALLALVSAVALGGCQSAGWHAAEGASAGIPTYDAVYERAEWRVGDLDRLWAIASVGLRYVDAEGDRHRDQGEGHFQVVRPETQVALTIGKLGEVYLLLGCDAQRFWWINRTEERVAYVGAQAEARALALDQIGVPMLPTDLLILADLNRWPEPGISGAGEVSRSDRDFDHVRTVMVEFDEPGRRRRVYLNAQNFDPVGVDLLTDSGELIARSTLKNLMRVDNRIDPTRPQWVPTRLVMEIPSAESRVEIELSHLEMSRRRPKAVVFNFDELVRRFGVKRIVEIGLDDPRRIGRAP